MAKKGSRKKIGSNAADVNPFNIKINRKKHSVLGQKVKGTQGLPGISHALGHAKRKELLLKKKVQSQKANRFLDKRLLDSSQIPEEHTTLRLVQERKRKLKKNIFNLNDEEDLTHKGKRLFDIENFDEKVSGSEDEEQLDASFVKQAHFGGFASDRVDEQQKSHKEIINELIIESKIRKQEKKIENELNADLTEKLDKDWKEMHTLIFGIKTEKPKLLPEKKNLPEKNDPFDIVVNELKFDSRGTPASRLKSPEEVAKEEEKRLQILEEERRNRMTDILDKNIKDDNHISADSIYDGFDLDHNSFEENDHDECLQNKLGDLESDESVESESDLSDTDEEMKNEDIVNKTIVEKKVDVLSLEENEIMNIPQNKEDFDIIADCYAPNELSNIIQKILKPNLQCKSGKNLNKLETFFSLLIEHIFEHCNSVKNIDVAAVLFPHIFSIAEASPLKTAEKFLCFLDQEYEIFTQSKGKKIKNNFPRFESLIILKLSSIIYSVSDFRHPVVTPTIIFMCDILSSPFCISLQNIISRLFVCQLVLNCVSDSKRLVPEAVCFLSKMLQLATIEKKSVSSKGKKFNLVLDDDMHNEEIKEINLLDSQLLHCDNSVKLSVIFEIVNQLYKYAMLYQYIPSYSEIFSHTFSICSMLPVENYPNCLKESVSELKQIISHGNSLKYLTFQSSKPKPLKLFEPAFDSKFTRKKDDIPRKIKMIKSVSQKIKKEERGLLREMRREAQVVASEKLKEKLEADEERRQKVKKLYQDLAMQEGEYKKFTKNK